MTVGEFIKRWREQLQVQRERLALMSSVSPDDLAKIEEGEPELFAAGEAQPDKIFGPAKRVCIILTEVEFARHKKAKVALTDEEKAELAFREEIDLAVSKYVEASDAFLRLKITGQAIEQRLGKGNE